MLALVSTVLRLKLLNVDEQVRDLYLESSTILSRGGISSYGKQT